MTSRLVAWCTRHPWLVLAVALALGVCGELGRRSLSRDVIPDLSDPQIVLVADWMGHPAPEVAAQVTQVLTRALDGVPGSTAVRGSTMSGMAYIDVLFGSRQDLGRARQAIAERVAAVKLPANVRLTIGPLASSTGWVYQYAIIDPKRKKSRLELRRFQDEVLRPALAAIPGVAEVASVGGGVQQILVEARPYDMRTHAVAFSDLVTAVQPTFAAPHPPSAPAAPVLAALEALPIAPTGTPVRDVARVRLADDLPNGVADLDGGASAVGGIVIAERGANLPSVIDAVERTVAREALHLPAEVKVITVYNRLDVADRVEDNLLHALAEEVIVVVLIVLVFLLHGRSAIVPLTTLPLVVLLTFGAMWLIGLPATIMSLGGIGIALGMAVDADIVALEACHRRLEAPRGQPPPDDRTQRIHALIAAAGSFAPAILTSLVITALSFLPVFAFTGENGRLLRPLALTKTLVIAASAIVTLTVAPALRARLVAGRIRPEFDNPLTRVLVRLYRPFVHFALRQPVLTLVTAGLAVLSCLPIAAQLGGEFLPRVDEGDVLFMPTTLPGVPPDQAAAILRRQDRAINAFAEVDTVFGKVGRADTATDPAPYSMTETTIRLLPRSQWPKRHRDRWYSAWAPGPLRSALGLLWPEDVTPTTAELVAGLDRATRLPGWTNAWTAPARGRIDMMSTGVRTPVGIRIVAPDPKRLETLGAAVRTRALAIPGTRSAVFESLGGEPSLAFTPDTAAAARFGVDPALVGSTADLVIKGGQVSDTTLDGRPLRVRVMPDFTERSDADLVRETTVRGAENGPVPLSLLGQPAYVTRPATIRTERGELCAYIYVDLEPGTDLAGYVERAQHALSRETLSLASAERIEWTGQYELITAGQARLRWIIPLVALSMLGLLLYQFRSLTEALIVLVAVPFALVGSVWTLYLLGYPMSAPVWLGLLSVVGLAMQTGVVMVVYIDEAFHRRIREGRLATRDDIVSAHAEGTVRRLRPKLMTITTMALALVPLLWADGAGAEIMRRVAAPMIGGLATSAFLTLEVLPVLYTIWRYRQLRRAQRLGVSIESIVGPAPSWARR